MLHVQVGGAMRSSCIILTLVLTCSTLALGDNLEASADFHSVTLHWGGAAAAVRDQVNTAAQKDDALSSREARTVVVTFCEVQAWGPHRCKDKSVTAARAGRGFAAQVNGLRMATKYSFRVRPDSINAMDTERSYVTDPLPVSIVQAQTRGFSARATLCLANSTEVEVDTGPYFGGRISVEALSGSPGEIVPSHNADTEGTSCSVWGDPQSTRATYRLRFDHEACGGTRTLNRSAVATFILVQESLPILTHSTRRFLVLCTAQPDTLTVSAGISLPGGVDPAQASENSVAGTGSAEPQRVARLLRNPSVPPVMLPTLHEPQTQQLPHLQQQLGGSSGAQLVLMLALVSTVAVGSGFAAWWVVRRHRLLHAVTAARRRDHDSTSTNAVTLSRKSSYTANDYDDDFSITTYDNFTTGRSAGRSALASSESEASSVLRADDTTSCSSVDSCNSLSSAASSSSSSGDEAPVEIRILQEPPARVHANQVTTTINIHREDEATQSEA